MNACSPLVKVTQSMVTHARGICEFDPASQAFTQVKLLELEGLHPTGHPVRVVDNGIEYVYFAHPFPYTRVRATIDAYLDPAQYEAYTCLEASSDDTPNRPT